MTLFYPTPHLLEKLKLRNVSWGEIVDICEKPEVVYGPDPQGRKVLQKGELAVVLAPGNAVVTVLLRDAEKWTDQKARDRRVEICVFCYHPKELHEYFLGCVECPCKAPHGRGVN